MLRTKPILLFLFKVILVFGLLVAPFTFYDVTYGKFYRSVCKSLFGKIKETGFARFSQTKTPEEMHIEIGNAAQRQSNGMTNTAIADVNLRYRGYMSTVFLIALIIASPITTRRKIFSALAGLAILTGILMFKQWIHILYMCEQVSWLALYDFTPHEKQRIEFLFNNFANYSGSTLIMVIPVWILVCFRKSDLELIKK